jgi:hypothetical protein
MDVVWDHRGLGLLRGALYNVVQYHRETTPGGNVSAGVNFAFHNGAEICKIFCPLWEPMGTVLITWYTRRVALWKLCGFEETDPRQTIFLS